MSLFETDKNSVASSNRFLEFNLGGESYAVELLKVKEVLTPPEMIPIPKTPSYVCGLMNLRGNVLTVIDLRIKLGIIPEKENSQNGVIIFDLEDRLLGVMVDSIQRVIYVETDNIKSLPDSSDGVVPKMAFLVGVLKQEDKLSMWLNPQLLLEPIYELKKVA
jgi:purine-binding chemotaxis protein CheW